MIYTWRILENQVPNFTQTPIVSQGNIDDRCGRKCRIPEIKQSAPCRIKTMRYSSLAYDGPKLFNCLPLNIRNITKCSVEQFKTELDKFLAEIPDQPLIPKLTHQR